MTVLCLDRHSSLSCIGVCGYMLDFPSVLSTIASHLVLSYDKLGTTVALATAIPLSYGGDCISLELDGNLLKTLVLHHKMHALVILHEVWPALKLTHVKFWSVSTVFGAPQTYDDRIHSIDYRYLIPSQSVTVALKFLPVAILI